MLTEVYETMGEDYISMVFSHGPFPLSVPPATAVNLLKSKYHVFFSHEIIDLIYDILLVDPIPMPF